MENKKTVKPKQYSHINYEALLIYIMKKHISMDQAIEELNLNIARATVTRNINKIKADNNENAIIDLYQKIYTHKNQNKVLPKSLQNQIDELPELEVVKKDGLEDLYKKLSYMKEIVEICNGNLAEAARVISAGKTILGNIKITRQGLTKDLKRYEIVKEAYEQQHKEKNKEEIKCGLKSKREEEEK